MAQFRIYKGQIMASALSPEKLTFEALVDVIGLERLARKAGSNKSNKSKMGPVMVKIIKREVCE